MRGVRTLAALALGIALGLPLVPVHAQQPYPSKPIRIVVGFPAGTAPDVISRLIAPKLQESWNVGVLVEIKAGATGAIAGQDVARAAPDGYTLLVAGQTQISLAPSTRRNLPFNPLTDFAPVSEIAAAEGAFTVGSVIPAKTMAEYMNWVKTQKTLFLADLGEGTTGHFLSAMLGMASGTKWEAVHYKSSGDSWAAILSGEVHGTFASVPLAAPLASAGKVRILATTGPVRSHLSPSVPTFKESGWPDLESMLWYGMLAPAKTPPEILDKLHAEIVKLAKLPEVRAKLEGAGFHVTAGAKRAEFARMIRDDAAKWAKVVSTIGFKPAN